MNNTKTHIYLMPGLAASPKIFNNLIFPKNKVELHYLEWILPLSEKEKLEDYAKRMSELVTEANPVLIGVSFGGILVQEISKFLRPKKIIIISSIKSSDELPKRLKLIQKTKAYKLFPAKAISNIEAFSVFAFGEFAKKRVKLYQEYLSVRDEKYLKWAVFNVLNWKQKTSPKNIIHIQGEKDHIFPIKNINNCISIPNGTHIMILTKAKRISKIITDIL
ncbi:alpha/beta hydrolase [Lutibacter aestuarii]|uniref:Alpha/beta hydrolase n=1 Tax=Lutibacter aestuarii TaxID=861111 RepID=A0ABW2Z8T3_9FLAO